MTRRARLAARALGICGAVAIVILQIFDPQSGEAGWLMAFSLLSSVGLGATALLLIHRLTGGKWGRFARPALATSAAACPRLIILFLFLLPSLRALYPWTTEPAVAGPGVASHYLNFGFFTARSLVFLLVLAVPAVLISRGLLGRLAAALALIWYSLGMQLVSFDWLLSIEPRYASSAFGVQIIVLQLIAALALVILVQPGADDAPEWNDIGSLLLASSLGEAYLVLMTYMIHWYGDLPDQAAFYLKRSAGGWAIFDAAAVVFFSIVPLLTLLFRSVRSDRAKLRFVAIAALLGVVSEIVWLVAPDTRGGAWCVLSLVLALATVAAISAGFAPLGPVQSSEEVTCGV